MGIADALSSKQKPANNGFKPCIGGEVTREQLRDVVVKWLRNEPAEDRRYAALGLVAAAWSEAFPCRQ
jgi:hypothetical protein